MLSIEQVKNALNIIEEKIESNKPDLDKVNLELKAIRVWSNNIMRDLSSVGNKLLILEHKVAMKIREGQVGEAK